MRTFARAAGVLLVAAANAVATSAAPYVQEPVTAAEVRAHVLPDALELAWKALGWRASLWQGVIDAQAAGKPILLWAMNGHPLGCT
jgi:hypothetical protein